jgi:DNA topoisomerase IB
VPRPRPITLPPGARLERRGQASFVESDPVESAKCAGLRYVTDTFPGIRRKRAGKRFTYVDEDEQPVRDRRVLARIASLAIPPAWTDVWISPTCLFRQN